MAKVKNPENAVIVSTNRNEGSEELVNETNLPLGTYVYPEPDGRPLGDYNFVSLSFFLDGATLTFEVPVEKRAPYTNWADISPAGYSLTDDSTSAGPFTSAPGIPMIKVVDWERVMTGRYRIVIQPTAPVNRVVVYAEERFV